MRCDVNISVRPRTREAFGTKVEIKNMNSFNAMQRAIEYEFDRQTTLLREGRGEEIVQETRLWDDGRQCTASMRKKEGLADYRYFPEPDLPPLVLTQESIDALRATLPELPEGKRARYQALGLSQYDALVLSDDVDVAAFFDGVLSAGAPPKPAAKEECGTAPAADDELDDDVPMVDPRTKEWGGPTKGGSAPEPTRFGDWERKGRCTDFS